MDILPFSAPLRKHFFNNFAVLFATDGATPTAGPPPVATSGSGPARARHRWPTPWHGPANTHHTTCIHHTTPKMARVSATSHTHLRSGAQSATFSPAPAGISPLRGRRPPEHAPQGRRRHSGARSATLFGARHTAARRARAGKRGQGRREKTHRLFPPGGLGGIKSIVFFIRRAKPYPCARFAVPCYGAASGA
jgi:hypothetical protein